MRKSMTTTMKTKKDIKDITDVLNLANLGLESTKFIIDYWNKTPEEREEVNEKARRLCEAAYEIAVLYFKSSESQKEAISVELRKLGEKLAVAELHKILGINTPDISNEMKFVNPYQYSEDR